MGRIAVRRMNGTRSVCPQLKVHLPQIDPPGSCPRLVRGTPFPFIQSHGCALGSSRSKEWNLTELLEMLYDTRPTLTFAWSFAAAIHRVDMHSVQFQMRWSATSVVARSFCNSNCPSQGTGTAHCRGEVA